MPKKRHKSEVIVATLRQVDVLIRAGVSAAFQNVCHWLRGLKIRSGSPIFHESNLVPGDVRGRPPQRARRNALLAGVCNEI